MPIFLRTVQGVAEHFPARWTEWVMMAPAIGTAAAFHLQPHLFETAPQYAELASWAEESTWEAIILISAAFRLLALIVNGTFGWLKWSPVLRLFGAAVGAAIWAQFSLGHFVTFAEIGTTVAPVISYGALALVEFGNVTRSAHDVGVWAKGAS